MLVNDKTIFKYLHPNENDILSKINKRDLDEIFKYINRYYLEYRGLLGFDNNITFGIEIEMEHFKGGFHNIEPFRKIITSLGKNSEWDVKNDITLINGYLDFGREIVSDILVDSKENWLDMKNICNEASLWGVIGSKCGGHVHVGAQILGSKPLYWYRFIKLCSIYENIIYRFCYGEYLTHRQSIHKSAKPCALLYNTRLPIIEDKMNDGLLSMLLVLDSKPIYTDSLKNYGISFWHMICDDNYDNYEDYDKVNKYCTVEYRASNGTFDYVIWQNNINFFVNLLLYCKSDKFDDEILDRRYLEVCNNFSDMESYSKIYLEQVIELCDMIFSNNLDKVYFLRQYLKSFEEADKPFIKAKKFTTTGSYGKID